MKLQSLKIELQNWGEHAGNYTGVATFAGAAGTLGIVLSPAVTHSFLALAGDLIVAHVEVAGKALQESIDVSVREALSINMSPKEIAAAAAGFVKMLEAKK